MQVQIILLFSYSFITVVNLVCIHSSFFLRKTTALKHFFISLFQCDAKLCKPICSTDSNCLSNELCIKNVCQEICRADSDCRSNEICQGVQCVQGCRSNTDCPSKESCQNNQCIGKSNVLFLTKIIVFVIFVLHFYSTS